MSQNAQISFVFAASPADVFRAFADPGTLQNWDPDRVEGRMEEGQSVTMSWSNFGVSLPVEVVRRDENQRLTLRAQRPDGPEQILDVRLTAREGGCACLLEIGGPMSEDERAGTLAGWHSQLRILSRYLALGCPTMSSSFAAMGVAMAHTERIFEAFCHPGRWLCREELLLSAEKLPFFFTTMHGDRITGETIAFAKERELVLWCNEIGGVLRMRSVPLALAGARLVGISVRAWESVAPQFRQELESAVDRLVGLLHGKNLSEGQSS